MKKKTNYDFDGKYKEAIISAAKHIEESFRCLRPVGYQDCLAYGRNSKVKKAAYMTCIIYMMNNAFDHLYHSQHTGIMDRKIVKLCKRLKNTDSYRAMKCPGYFKIWADWEEFNTKEIHITYDDVTRPHRRGWIITIGFDDEFNNIIRESLVPTVA